MSPHQICQLLDILVKPILTFACEVWAADLDIQAYGTSGKLEHELKKKSTKTFLPGIWGCVLPHLDGNHLRGEFGGHPLALFLCEMLLTYHARLQTLDKSRLLSVAFKHKNCMATQYHQCWSALAGTMMSTSEIQPCHVGQGDLKDRLKSKFTAWW